MNNIENNINIIENYDPALNNSPVKTKRNIREAIDILTNSNEKMPANIKAKVKAIGETDIPKIPTLLKVLQYVLHRLTFGLYESSYISSKKLKQSAENFLFKHSSVDREAVKSFVNPANVNNKVNGQTLLDINLENGNIRNIRSLVNNGAKVSEENKQKALADYQKAVANLAGRNLRKQSARPLVQERNRCENVLKTLKIEIPQ